MIKKSVSRRATPVKGVEVVEGSKVFGRIFTKDGRTFTLIKGDRVIVIRRKRMVQPK